MAIYSTSLSVCAPLLCGFAVPAMKKWSLFLHHLNLGCLCDLFWLKK